MNNQSFFSKVVVPKTKITIKHQESVLLIGSCFAQNIGEKLMDNKFNSVINPFGIIYNPLSIVKSLKRIVTQQKYTEGELYEYDSKFLSFDHHGSFSAISKEESLSKINEELTVAFKSVKSTKTIFITFGSAWVYEFPNRGIVANCHKIPNKQFKKRLLSVKEIIAAFDSIKSVLKKFNVVFTVSPVRHVKDGLHENNLSKATLHLVIKTLAEQNENYHYFPAYELIIDELRDYRFFKDDLVHPTDLAINYVWDKFLGTYCNEKTLLLVSEIQKIKTAVSHKPFNFKSEAHQQFIAKQVELMDELSKQHLFLDFKQERKKIIQQ